MKNKKNTTNKTQDLLIIGGGIIGLMTAYYASGNFNKITILEKRKIGNDEASSFTHYSRSIYNGYLDTSYASLAKKSQQLWRQIESESKTKLYIKCGVLNIASKIITPGITRSYAQKSY